MYREITLQMNDGREKTFGFLATGATSMRYRMVFGEDMIIGLLNLMNGGTSADTTASDRLAFIMNAQAERKDMTKLSLESFIEWADQFDGGTLNDHMNDFVGMYFNQRKTTSTAKKEAARQTEK